MGLTPDQKIKQAISILKNNKEYIEDYQLGFLFYLINTEIDQRELIKQRSREE